MAKYNIDKEETKSTLCFVLTGILKMLHPFMPFVTEEIYSMLPVKEKKSIMISSCPEYDKKLVFENEEKIVNMDREKLEEEKKKLEELTK